MILSKDKKYFDKILLFCFALIISLFALELLIRLNPSLYCQGYKPSRNEEIVYELFPHYAISSLKAKISSQGLNDRYFPFSKSQDIFRIAVVGDSTSFGFGVEPENSFPKILEHILNERENKKSEVINFSVPGYNTSQEFAIIKEKVIKFHPDMVILVFCGNDTHISNYFKSDITFLNYLYNKSYFFHFVLRRLDLLINLKLDHPSIKRWWLTFKKKILGMFYCTQIIYPYPGLEETIYIDWNPPISKKEVPNKYWYMLGYDNYKIHLSNIYHLLKEKNVEFISSGIFDSESLNINHELGVERICNFGKVIRVEDHLFNDTTSFAYGHFNLRGHYSVAEYIYNFLKENNLIY